MGGIEDGDRCREDGQDRAIHGQVSPGCHLDPIPSKENYFSKKSYMHQLDY